ARGRRGAVSSAVQQALSALLPPLRFAERVGLQKLKSFEPLVREAVARALPHAGAHEAQLRRLLEVVEGFDIVGDDQRRAALDEVALVAGIIAAVNEVRGCRGRKRLEISLRDERRGELQLVWFNYRVSMLERLRIGSRALVSGEVKRGFRGGVAMHYPDVEPLSEQGQRELGDELAVRNDDSFGRVVPI